VVAAAASLGGAESELDFPSVGATEKPEAGRFPLFVMAVVVLGAIALTLGVFREFSSVLAPTFLAINLVITAYPVYQWLTRHHVPRVLAALITGVMLLLILVVATGSIVWAGTSMVASLTSYGSQFTELYTQLITWLGTLGFDEAALLEQLKSISPSNVISLVGNVVSQASSATGTVTVILICLAFLVADLPTMAKRLAITNRLHPSFTGSLEDFAVGIRRYWLVTSLFGLIVAVLDGIALVLVGVSLPLVWVVLSFITNYIPNVGFFIGLIPPALLAENTNRLTSVTPNPAITQLITAHFLGGAAGPLVLGFMTGSLSGFGFLWYLLAVLLVLAGALYLMPKHHRGV